MLEKIKLEKVLSLDIETVPQYTAYDELPERWKKLWNKKARILARTEEDTPETLYERAGIYAEFGKIICISCGFLYLQGSDEQFRVKSFFGHDEKVILDQFFQMLRSSFSQSDFFLCAHNGKEFDFPYLCRRGLVHGLRLPYQLDLSGKKPWEVQHLDTMQLWKFGDFKSYTSLDLMAACFDVPTPKDDIDGSMVRAVYYTDRNLERIRRYCEKDVLTLFNVLRRMTGKPIIEDNSVVIIE